ncbi:MAG TPA: phage terminase small subunit P27 family [Phycisphaerales bacterium]|nr:phage terminase small subunit P27 family [Phycisphaerales bacterium]
MAKRGRKPLSNKVKKTRGTYRKDRATDESLIFQVGVPEKPQHLTGLASELWDKWAPELVQKGFLTPLDGATFTVLCQSHADYIGACEQLNNELIVKTSQGNLKPHPLLKIKDKAFQNHLKARAELGLSEHLRKKIANETDGPFQRLLNRAKIVKKPEDKQ